MSLLKSMLAGAGLSLALATAASAQSMTPDFHDGVAMVVMPNGSLTWLGGQAAKVNVTGHRMLMRHARQLKPGTIIYRSGGHLYALDNKMINGHRVDHHAKSWI